MGNKTSTIVAGMCGTVVITYCIYFDGKRRSDPNFKKKLRERRRKLNHVTKEKTGLSTLPDLKDPEAVQKFCLDEIKFGEQLLFQGDVEEAVDHLALAVSVCGQHLQLLHVFHQTLSPAAFQMLLTKLPSVRQRITSALSVAEDDDD